MSPALKRKFMFSW